jgi:hypothetical protein
MVLFAETTSGRPGHTAAADEPPFDWDWLLAVAILVIVAVVCLAAIWPWGP